MREKSTPPSLENRALFKAVEHVEHREIGVLRERVNARKHSPAQIKMIARSMEEFGWTTPVLIDETDTIIAGYGRVAAAAILGLSKVPVLVAKGWSEAQKRAYLLADNQIALQAGWDEDLLKVELADLKLLNFDISLIGFDPHEVNTLFSIGKLQTPQGNLKDQFLLAPFSVLDGRSGWWQTRKRAWLALGIQSELGRGDNVLNFSETILEPDRKKREAAKETPSLKGGLTFGLTIGAYKRYGEPL